MGYIAPLLVHSDDATRDEDQKHEPVGHQGGGDEAKGLKPCPSGASAGGTERPHILPEVEAP